MICLRCGYCCVQYDVIIVDDPSIGIFDSEKNLKVKHTGERCQHLTGDTCGDYACVIHDRPWYEETPCYRHGQIERSADTPCRMGRHLLEKAKMKDEKKRGWVFVDDDTEEEVGFAEPSECQDADHAVHSFGKEYPSDFSVYFRDSNGELESCSAEDRPEDFD